MDGDNIFLYFIKDAPLNIQVILHRSVEHFADFSWLLGLSQYPHQLGNNCLCCHVVGLYQTIFLFDDLSDHVHGHIASFMGNLRGHNKRFATSNPVGYGIDKALIVIAWDAAYTRFMTIVK